MRCHDDEWLQQKIEEDMIAMADERERILKASESYQHIDMSEKKQKELRIRILEEMELREEEQNNQVQHPFKETVLEVKRLLPAPRRRIRFRPVIMAATVLVLCLGLGMAGTGSRVYIPEIFQRYNGDEETLKINNTEAVAKEYNEEDVCIEIEEKLGVIPIRFGYRPKGMFLSQYNIWKTETEVLMEYECDKKNIFIYISKDWNDSVISNQVDGEKRDTIMITSCGLEIPVYEYTDPKGETYYEASFEYLNTYYSLNGMIELEEFKMLLENIWIKNA